jgi:hypothetical protein
MRESFSWRDWERHSFRYGVGIAVVIFAIERSLATTNDVRSNCGEQLGHRLMNNIPIGFKPIGLRARYRFAILIFAVNGMVLIFLSLHFSELFLIALFILLLVCGLYTINLKCPVCGKPVLLNPVNNLGIEMYAYTPTIPCNCSKCGTELV